MKASTFPQTLTEIVRQNAAVPDLLGTWLQGIIEAEETKDYAKRNILIYAALSTATDEGLEGGIRLDPQEPEWPVVFIELPTGQVSWHVAAHHLPWDGHDTPTKYERVRAYLKAQNG
jgi:hypothetical protein